DSWLYDGRLANNGWLQELPRPLSKLTWGNAVLIAPRDAERLGLANGAVVEIEVGGRRSRGPVWIAPGQAVGSVTLNLGGGRRRAGRVGNGVGFDACVRRTSDAPGSASGLVLRKTGEHEQLACVQDHHSLHGRPIVRGASLEEYRAHPDFAREMGEDPPPDDSLYPNYAYDGNAWGMAIDLNACVGCNA